MNILDLRYRFDSPEEYGFSTLDSDQTEKRQEIRSRNLSRSVLIAPELFPEIAGIIDQVRAALIPDRQIEGYVFNSGEGQAYSFGEGMEGTVTLALSSGLIERFSSCEIQFIVGHEISHTLFGHLRYPVPDGERPPLENFNLLALTRAREITADRIGFIACGSAESSFRAMLKLASGLSDEHIRFDLATYLDQARELLSIGGSRTQLLSTHPMITSRIKALMWFEMSDGYYEFTGKRGKAPLSRKKLEDKVSRELAAAAGHGLARMNQAAANQAVLWGILGIFLADGTLQQQEQVLLRKTFGEKAADRAVEFAVRSNSSDLEAKLTEKVYSASRLPASVRSKILTTIEALASLTETGDEEDRLMEGYRSALKIPSDEA